MPVTRFRGGEIYGIRIPTLFQENNAIRCEGCGARFEDLEADRVHPCAVHYC